MCLLGISSKNFHPALNIPQIPKILHYESSFSRKTRVGSAAKIRIRIEKSPLEFQIWDKNFRFVSVLYHHYVLSRMLLALY